MVDSTNGVLNVSPCPLALDETLESIAGCCKHRSRIPPGPISAGGRLACRSRELSGFCVLLDFFVADYRDRATGGADGVTRTRVRTAGGFPINLKHSFCWRDRRLSRTGGSARLALPDPRRACCGSRTRRPRLRDDRLREVHPVLTHAITSTQLPLLPAAATYRHPAQPPLTTAFLAP